MENRLLKEARKLSRTSVSPTTSGNEFDKNGTHFNKLSTNSRRSFIANSPNVSRGNAMKIAVARIVTVIEFQRWFTFGLQISNQQSRSKINCGLPINTCCLQQQLDSKTNAAFSRRFGPTFLDSSVMKKCLSQARYKRRESRIKT